MSEQAIETDELEITEDLLEESEQLEDQPDKGEPDEVELVVEGEDEPTSAPIRKSGFQKRLHRIAGQRDAAKDEVAEERRKREAAEEEAKLWKLKATQDQSKPPNEDDFETDAEFQAAKTKYDDAILDAKLDERLKEKLATTQSATTQQSHEQRTIAAVDAYREKSPELKVKDFDQAEDAVAEIMGDDALKYIAVNHGKKAHMMIYHLAKNPGKAQQLADLLAQGTAGAVPFAQRLTRLEDGLKIKTKTSLTPEPESQISGGTAAGDPDFMKGVKIY